MSTFEDLSFERTLPLTIFNQLGQVLQQIAQEVGTQAVVLTEAILSTIPIIKEHSQQFTLLVSPQFSALLVGVAPDIAGGYGGINPNGEFLNVTLTFEPEAIALFISQLKVETGDLLSLPQHYSLQARLNQYCHQPNDGRLQSKFTLLLLSLLTSELYPEPASDYPYVSVCQPVEDALRQQIAHEQLLNQLTTGIHQSQAFTRNYSDGG